MDSLTFIGGPLHDQEMTPAGLADLGAYLNVSLREKQVGHDGSVGYFPARYFFHQDGTAKYDRSSRDVPVFTTIMFPDEENEKPKFDRPQTLIDAAYGEIRSRIEALSPATVEQREALRLLDRARDAAKCADLATDEMRDFRTTASTPDVEIVSENGAQEPV